MGKKIKQLDTPTIPLTGGELFEASQENISVKLTLNQLVTKFKDFFTTHNQTVPHDYVVSPRGEATGTSFLSAGSFPVSAGKVGLNQFISLVFKEKLWVIGGILDDGAFGYSVNPQAISSYDGLNWKVEGTLNIEGQITGRGLFGVNGVVWRNRMWIVCPGVSAGVGGATFNVYSSLDGINWDLEGEHPKVFTASISKTNFKLVLHDDKLWTIGGNETGSKPILKIFYTEDGKKWFEAGTDSFPASAGASHPGAVSFNNLLWIIGGNPSGALPQLNDVFYSSDGANWTQLAGVLPGQVSAYIGSEFVYDGKIWIGQPRTPNAFSSTSYMWYSVDGQTWTQVTGDMTINNLRWIPFNGRIYGLGGADGSFVYQKSIFISDLLLTGMDLSDINHNQLSNKQGGNGVGQYYHLTKAIHDGLYSGSPVIGIGASGSGTNIQADYGNNQILSNISGNKALTIGEAFDEYWFYESGGDPFKIQKVFGDVILSNDVAGATMSFRVDGLNDHLKLHKDTNTLQTSATSIVMENNTGGGTPSPQIDFDIKGDRMLFMGYPWNSEQQDFNHQIILGRVADNTSIEIFAPADGLDNIWIRSALHISNIIGVPGGAFAVNTVNGTQLQIVDKVTTIGSGGDTIRVDSDGRIDAGINSQNMMRLREDFQTFGPSGNNEYIKLNQTNNSIEAFVYDTERGELVRAIQIDGINHYMNLGDIGNGVYMRFGLGSGPNIRMMSGASDEHFSVTANGQSIGSLANNISFDQVTGRCVMQYKSYPIIDIGDQAGGQGFNNRLQIGQNLGTVGQDVIKGIDIGMTGRQFQVTSGGVVMREDTDGNNSISVSGGVARVVSSQQITLEASGAGFGEEIVHQLGWKKLIHLFTQDGGYGDEQFVARFGNINNGSYMETSWSNYYDQSNLTIFGDQQLLLKGDNVVIETDAGQSRFSAGTSVVQMQGGNVICSIDAINNEFNIRNLGIDYIEIEESTSLGPNLARYGADTNRIGNLTIEVSGGQNTGGQYIGSKVAIRKKVAANDFRSSWDTEVAFVPSGTEFGVDAQDKDNYTVTINSILKLKERSIDPPEPEEGEAIVWMSDGTGKGNDGDVMIASKAGGTTRYSTLFAHASGGTW